MPCISAVAFLFVAAFMLCSGQAFAQSKSVTDVVVEGNQRIEKATILSYMTIVLGSEVTNRDINASLKALFATGLFADVAIRRAGTKLVVNVEENPVMNQVYFEGNKRLKDEDLLSEIELRPRLTMTRSRVKAAVQRLLQLYRLSGRYAAQIEPKLVRLPQNRVNVIFEINEGDVTKIQKIEFIGNRRFSDRLLSSQIASKAKSILRPFTSADRFDADRLELDKELMRRFYLKEGYADFRIVSATAELFPDHSAFYLVFSIVEGDRYKIREVNIRSTVPNVATEELRAVVSIDKNDYYNAEEIEDSVQAIAFELGRLGYGFVDVQSILSFDRDNDRIDLGFVIKEGPRVYVERINVRGNTRTLDKVIRREFRLVEGDAFDAAKLRRSQARIQNLGFFNKVDMTEQPGTAADKSVVNVDVQERSTGELSLGVGISTSDGPLGDVSIQERNLLGRGQKLRGAFRISGRTQEVDLSFTEPYFLERDVAAGFDIFRKTTDLQRESSFDKKNIGISLRVGYPLSEKLRQRFAYTLRKDTISNVSDDVSSFIRPQEGSAVESSITHSLTYNDLDSRFSPSSGYKVIVSQTLAGFGGTKRFMKNRLAYSRYYPFTENVIGAFEVDQGYILGIGDDVEISDRFFVGGGNFRGFRSAGIGPRDIASGDALGGNLYYIGTAELKWPLARASDIPLRGITFSQVGSLGTIDESGTNLFDIGKPRLSVGVGIAWESPVGPLRLDFSEALVKQRLDRTETIYFSFGTRF